MLPTKRTQAQAREKQKARSKMTSAELAHESMELRFVSFPFFRFSYLVFGDFLFLPSNCLHFRVKELERMCEVKNQKLAEEKQARELLESKVQETHGTCRPWTYNWLLGKPNIDLVHLTGFTLEQLKDFFHFIQS